MWNFLAVLVGAGVLMWLLFVRNSGAHKVLSASRWMLLAWGGLFLVHIVSPIRYFGFRLSWWTLAYSALWIGCFVLGDNVRFSVRSGREASRQTSESFHCTTSRLRVLTGIGVIGMLVLAHNSSGAVGGVDSVLADLRAAQLEGENGGLLKTVATIAACSGLVVALVEVSTAVFEKRRLSLLAGAGFASYLSVTILTAGRPGVVLGLISLLIAAVASVYLSGERLARFRSVILAGVLLLVAGVGYIALVVSTRTSGWTGGMDNKIELMNMLGDCEARASFRESLRPYGALGDTVIEAFYYLSPQLYGLEHSLRYFSGPYGWGASEFPYVTRRIESAFGVSILEAINKADRETFESRGVSPHFFQTAVQSTALDFGPLMSLPFVFLCGCLSRRARLKALKTRSPYVIGYQALVCTGAAWTIIYSPFVEQSWSFPLIWFIVIEVLCSISHSFQALFSGLVHSTHSFPVADVGTEESS